MKTMNRFVFALVLGVSLGSVAQAGAQVQWLSHADGDILAGVELLEVVSQTSPATAEMHFYVGGQLIGVDQQGANGWQLVADMATVPAGQQRITAVAYAAGRIVGIAPIYITIDSGLAMRVVDIEALSTGPDPSGWTIDMDVSIADEHDDPVVGAQVTLLCRDQASFWTVSAVTNAAGVATVTLPFPGTAIIGACGVRDVRLVGYHYDPRSNSDANGNTNGYGVAFR